VKKGLKKLFNPKGSTSGGVSQVKRSRGRSEKSFRGKRLPENIHVKEAPEEESPKSPED